MQPRTSLVIINLLFLDPPPPPRLLSNATDREHATITWEVPDTDQKQTIDHFIIQLDNNPQSLIKNNFTTVIVGESNSDHTITVMAVNKCEQRSSILSQSLRSGIEAVTESTTVVRLDLSVVVLQGNKAQDLPKQGSRWTILIDT